MVCRIGRPYREYSGGTPYQIQKNKCIHSLGCFYYSRCSPSCPLCNINIRLSEKLIPRRQAVPAAICLQPPESLCTAVSYWAEQISFPVLYENQNQKESALNIRMVLDSYRYMEADTARRCPQ